MTSDASSTKSLPAYKVGDIDTRPWGSYTVIAVGLNEDGEEFCEKEIIVNPGQVLSLQSHEHRREYWRVMQGTLTIIVDGKRKTLAKDEDVRIPKGALHCMANLGEEACVVQERQAGLCREEDITRYMDAYGRVEDKNRPEIAESLALYKQILEDIKKG